MLVSLSQQIQMFHTGLDSYTANEVMTVVRALLEDGTTICATIHSPTQVSHLTAAYSGKKETCNTLTA